MRPPAASPAPLLTLEDVSETAVRIMEGTLRAILRRGLQKATVSDVCEEAGISRRTFYRYFTGKNAVLEALALYALYVFQLELSKAVAERPEPDDRVWVIINLQLTMRDRAPDAARLVVEQTAFAFDYLTKAMPQVVGLLEPALEPFYERAPGLPELGITLQDFASLVAHQGTEAFLMSHTHTIGPEYADQVARLWAAAGRVSPKSEQGDAE